MACEECGNEFQSRISFSVTCSMPCYQARYRRINKERRAESKRLSYLKYHEQNRAKSKAFRKANADKLRAADRARRPRKIYTPRSCDQCGTEYTPRIAPQKYCSKACERKVRRWVPVLPVDFQRSCLYCEQRFTTQSKRQVYCNSKCRANASTARWRSAHPAQVSDSHRAWRKKNPVTARRRDQRRRATERSLPKESFADTEVFDRDGWICQLCKRKVDRRYKAPHPLSASLDHVVPLSVEGSPGHTVANSQLAHYGCNSRKKNRTVKGGEQLRLI